MSIPLKIETLAGGAVVEALEHEIQNMLNNIADPNTEAKKPREVRLVIKVKPNEHRNMADVLVQTSSKLVPAAPLETSILIDRGHTGEAVAAEMWAGEVPGQAQLPGVDVPTGKNVTNFNAHKEAANA